ncbi:DNA circularization N-terminal domain-containing protein [Amorphus sp. MBR-141]
MILDSVADLLPGLIPGQYRGVVFDVPDTRTEVGRRVAEHLFPGRDDAEYDDLGMLPEVVSVEGVLLGDDYIAQAMALRAAFKRPGPGTLYHPWFGWMRVIVDRPPEITFSSRELRVARFFAYFKRIDGDPAPASISTAAAVAAGASLLAASALMLIRAVDGLTISRIGAAASTRTSRVFAAAVTDTAGTVPDVRTGTGARAITAAAASPAATPGAVAGLVAATGAALRASVPALTAANSVVAPAFEAPAQDVGMSPPQGLDFALGLSSRLVAAVADAPSVPDQAMLLGTAAAMLAEAGPMLAQAEFSTRSEARAARAAIATETDRVTTAAEGLGETLFAAVASTTGRLAGDFRLAAIADINEVIGRLPQVVALTTTRPADAFQVAAHLFGDTPAAIEIGYTDIVARNRPRHPASLPAGRVEAAR